MKLRNLILLTMAMLIAFPWACEAQTNNDFADVFNDEPQFLPVDQAFQFDFNQRGDQLLLSWQIADGYYLYKKQFKTVEKDATLGSPHYPSAQTIEDEYFGRSDVYFNQVTLTYPIIQSVQDGVVKVRYQGCAEAGLCYPPTTKVVYLSAVDDATALASDVGPGPQATSEQFKLANLLSSKENLALSLLLFLALGIGLAFTPCVFPMYPILSGIVLGQGRHIRTNKAFALSFIYVQGMALTYSLLGLIVASAGVKFQAALQHPVILVSLILVFVVLAFAMFGTYQLQMPSGLQERLTRLSNQQKGGSIAGVFAMGAISGLVASPCTTAPLTGILLYIAQTGDLLLGFSALYALSLGMGIPLILFGVTGGKLLPRAGEWMNVVKVTFGFMMLAVALILVERMITHWSTELLWAALGVAIFGYFFTMNQTSQVSFGKGLRNAAIFVGLFVSLLYGYHHLPLPSSSGNVHLSQTKPQEATFVRVKDLEDFQAKLAKANQQGKSVMVDLYADWCVACKEFEKYTFSDAAVQQALANTVLMQIDLTDNTPTNVKFQEHFAILGLPTILFFNQQGKELGEARVTGFMPAAPFAEHVNTLLN